MPILHKGKQICSKCKKEFEWIHFEPYKQKLSNNPIVEEIPSELMVHHFSPMAIGKYEAEVNCPCCGYDNMFEFLDESAKA